MAGQIIKRGDKTWVVRIFTGRDEKGKRRYLNKTLHATKKDAEAYLSTTLTAMSTRTFVAPSSETLRGYLSDWPRTATRPRVSERTFVGYKYLLERYVEPELGDKRLSDLRALHIQKLYSDMQGAWAVGPHGSLPARRPQFRPQTGGALGDAVSQSGGAC